MLTFDQIKELIEIVTERSLQGLEIERSGFRLRIDGKARPAATVVDDGAAPSLPERRPAMAAELVAEPAAARGEPSEPPPAQESAPPDGTHVLNSPIVGTFYAAPSPDADPYVQVEDRVKKGQVLCIIEAMKLMNEIESDVDGTLIEVYPKNAQPVEYGEPLFAIRPD